MIYGVPPRSRAWLRRRTTGEKDDFDERNTTNGPIRLQHSDSDLDLIVVAHFEQAIRPLKVVKGKTR